MKIQYQIMELDKEYLPKKKDGVFDVVDRVCFIPAEFDFMQSNITDSFEELNIEIE